MNNTLVIKKRINNFKKTIRVSGDKSLSIRWVLFSSIASGISTAKNLLISEDVLSAINAIKKLGIKVIIKKKECKIFGKGIFNAKNKKTDYLVNLFSQKINSGNKSFSRNFLKWNCNKTR